MEEDGLDCWEEEEEEEDEDGDGDGDDDDDDGAKVEVVESAFLAGEGELEEAGAKVEVDGAAAGV